MARWVKVIFTTHNFAHVEINYNIRIISRLVVVNSVQMSKIISKNVGYDPVGFKGPRIQGFE